MTQDTSGPAFLNRYSDHDGMTLRDWFAGQALAGLLSHHGSGPAEGAAYEYADAMIAKRNNSTGAA